MENCLFMSLTLIYVLKLEDDCWYIGYTSNLNSRLAEHFGFRGRYKTTVWCDLHKPIKLVDVRIGTTDDENSLTLEYIEKYGFGKVRGGKWCKIHRIIPINYWLKKITV